MTSDYIDAISSFFILVKEKTLEISHRGEQKDFDNIKSLIDLSSNIPKKQLVRRFEILGNIIPILEKHTNVDELRQQLDIILAGIS